MRPYNWAFTWSRAQILQDSPAEQSELNIFLSENLHTRWICLSKSPMAVPVFFIKKKDSSLWLVQDYRNLNAVTVKNKYLLPLISELVLQLQEVKYFTKLDVCWGFNNVWIKPRDEWKAAFHTNYGIFEPLVMFFSMTNNLTTFQTMINDIFCDFTAEDIMIVYLDNISIFIWTLEEHHIAVQMVLEVLAKHRLFLYSEKCEFDKLQIEYLELVISKD